MKKASKILLTIAGVFNLVAAIGLIITGIVFAIMAFVDLAAFPIHDLVAELEQAFQGTDIPTEAIVTIVAAIVAVISFVGFGVGFVFLLITSIISFKGAKAKKKGILIANIVFGVMTDGILNIVGAILGIIALNKEANQEEPQVESEPAMLAEPAVEAAPVVEQEDEKEPEPKKEEPAKQEPAKPVRKDWFCPNCGAHNEGKFCASCGTKKPE